VRSMLVHGESFTEIPCSIGATLSCSEIRLTIRSKERCKRNLGWVMVARKNCHPFFVIMLQRKEVKRHD